MTQPNWKSAIPHLPRSLTTKDPKEWQANFQAVRELARTDIERRLEIVYQRIQWSWTSSKAPHGFFALRHLLEAAELGFDRIPPPGWGPYSKAAYIQKDHVPLYLWRKTRAFRFYTLTGRQIGPEQTKVAAAHFWANAQGYHTHLSDEVLLFGKRR